MDGHQGGEARTGRRDFLERDAPGPEAAARSAICRGDEQAEQPEPSHLVQQAGRELAAPIPFGGEGSDALGSEAASGLPDHQLVIVQHDPSQFSALRSAEHTSELQSLMRLPYADFRMKKQKTET